MTKKILSGIAFVSAILVLSLSSLSSTYLYAEDVSLEQIQAAQRQAEDSIQKAKDIASKTEFKLDTSKYRITQPIDPASQQTKTANQNPAASNGSIAKCEIVSSNIDIQVTRFVGGKNQRTQKFQDVADKLAKLIKSIKNELVDTKSLESQLLELNSKIKSFNSVQDDYVASTSSAKSFSCTKPENEFKSSLEISQSKLKDVKNSAKDLQDYVQKNIQPEVQSFKSQAQK
jgi:hypothetical protein